MNWDYPLFLWLNFDGGKHFDAFMAIVSGRLTWLPLYLFILFLVWRRGGWRSLGLFALCVIAAVGLSDIITGIFKHSGLLKHAWESFPVRLRPMHTSELEGLMHITRGGSKYGTVSAHAAISASIAYMATMEIRSRIFTISLIFWVVLVSYSRIYLACHFPQDILLGWGTGILCAIPPYMLYRRLAKK